MATLKEHMVYQLSYQAVGVILPLFTMPYVARVLGADNSGIYSYVNTIANYFFVFGMLGLEQYGARSIARARDNYHKMSIVFSELLAVHIMASAVVIFCYFIFVCTLYDSIQYIFLLQGLYVISALFDINWFYFGIEKFKLTVQRNAIIKIISAIAIFLFVKTQQDLSIYTFIMAFSALLSQIVMWPMLKGYVSLSKIEYSSMNKHWGPLVLLFIAVIAANLNRMVDKIMLGWLGVFADLGCYDYADKIVRVPLGVFAAAGTVMLSRMSNILVHDTDATNENILSISACWVLFISVGTGFGVAAVAPELVMVYLGDEYVGAVKLLQILAISIPIVAWNNFIRTQVLIPEQKDKIYAKAIVSGAVINIVANYALIAFWGAVGAAIATLIAYAVILLIQTVGMFKSINNTSEYVGVSLVAGVIMFGAVRLSTYITVPPFWVEVLIGLVAYGGISLGYLKYRHPELFLKSQNLFNGIDF